ncbi:MAG: SLBB domain-containing protein [Nannocystaceae bacterium]|nr:SLBB domain-containing protein [Nannocystaceae bacterium]
MKCVFEQIREPGRATLEGYRRTGGYQALTRARADGPEATLSIIDDSRLAGRGGAGFPTGRKWRAVADADARGGEKTIVCNADEGEPGCFKDRVLMDYDPHALLEGMAIAAFCTGASRGFIYLRYEYPQTLPILERAIAEAKAAGLLDGFDQMVRRGAGAYVCGEETSLLNSLEGKHPFPRNRPPYPVTHGFEDRPTVVNNVETLCAVAPILVHGGAWYRGLGLGQHAGTKLISLSGDVQRPGNYEVPMGLPLTVLIDEWAGGPLPGRTVQAATMAGLSGGFLAGDDLDATLDEPALRAKGSFLGAGGIIVFDDTRDMVEVSRQAMAFFAHESCGKCFPCRIGTQRLTERLSGSSGPKKLAQWTAEVQDIGDTMKATSACGLGVAAPLITDSLLRYFPEQVQRHVANTENNQS